MASQLDAGSQETSNDNNANLASFDLTEKMSPFWDVHLVLQAVEFFADSGIYPQHEIALAKVDLLQHADMLDYLIESAVEGGLPVKDEWSKRREEVMELSKKYDNDGSGFIDALSQFNEDRQQEDDVDGRISIAKLHERYSVEGDFNFPANAHDVLMAQCKHIYRTGDYMGANHYLQVVIDGVCELTTDGWTFQSKLTALWGSLASSLLVAIIIPNSEGMSEEEWLGQQAMRTNLGAETAVLRLFEIDSMLDQPNNPMTKKEVRLHRVWLLHWTLWVLFKIFLDPAVIKDQPDPERLIDKRQKVLDFFFQFKNIAIAQLLAPHLFRYYAVALIMFKRKQEVSAVLAGVRNAATKIEDPFVSLLASVHEVTDFAESRKNLEECLKATKVDFFLHALKQQIADQSRLLVFESYCGIHSAIDLNVMAGKLALDAQEAERWVVNLIRTSRLDAKIDSAKNRVVIFADGPNVYQQVLERTQPLFLKSQYILTKKGKDNRQQHQRG